MNVHSDEWINQKVKEHYEEATTLIDPSHIVAICLQGSQNYGLDYENSDIDTKLIVTPSVEDIIFNRKPISTTHVRANEEHIDIKDVRLYLQTFRKQNLNFIEILFSPYTIINPFYKDEWERLIKNREAIGRYNPVQAVRSMYGIASEKYFALEHEYPSKVDILAKYGYDPKQLHHLFRIENFIYRYIKGEPYADCMSPTNPNFLMDVKRGKFDLEYARKYGKETIDRIKVMYENFKLDNQEDCDLIVEGLLNQVQKDIMLKSIKKEVI